MNIQEILEQFMPKPIPGYVYAVQFDDGAVKIGSTKNTAERFYTLQYYYRNKRTKIERVYVSDFVEDSRGCERKAQQGLKPIEKKEVYGISFGEAVRRVKKATNTKEDFITCSREETENVFPCLIPTEEGLERLLNKIIYLAKTAQENAVVKGL